METEIEFYEVGDYIYRKRYNVPGWWFVDITGNMNGPYPSLNAAQQAFDADTEKSLQKAFNEYIKNLEEPKAETDA
jgi:hypothetical protein